MSRYDDRYDRRSGREDRGRYQDDEHRGGSRADDSRREKEDRDRRERRRSRSRSREGDRRRRSRSRERRRSRSRSRGRDRRHTGSRSPRHDSKRRRGASEEVLPPLPVDLPPLPPEDAYASGAFTEDVGDAMDEEGREGVKAIELDAELTPEELQLMQQMGIPFGFDSTSGKHVDDERANAGAVKVQTTRGARQYMNRKGGFNRPLPAERSGQRVGVEWLK